MIDRVKDILDLNNSFFSFFKKIGWVFLLNILFLVTSIPIVTIGASATAMYTVLAKMIEEREFSFFKDYFTSFRENFLQSTAMWLFMLVITGIIYLDFGYVFQEMTGGFAYVMRIGTIVLGVLFCMIANAVFPLVAKFDMTWKEIIPTVIQIALCHVGLSLESVAFTLAVLGGAALILSVGWFGGLFIILPLAAPGLHAFMQSYLYGKMFSYYIEDEEQDPDYVMEYHMDDWEEK